MILVSNEYPLFKKQTNRKERKKTMVMPTERKICTSVKLRASSSQCERMSRFHAWVLSEHNSVSYITNPFEDEFGA